MKRPAEDSGPSGSVQKPKAKAKTKAAGGPKSKAKGAKAKSTPKKPEEETPEGGAEADEDSKVEEMETKPPTESTMKKPAACKVKPSGKAKGKQAALKRPAAAFPAEIPDGDKGPSATGRLLFFWDPFESEGISLKLVATAASFCSRIQHFYGVDCCARRQAC